MSHTDQATAGRERHGFRAGVRRSVGSAVGRDAQGGAISRLCRALLQYRSVAAKCVSSIPVLLMAGRWGTLNELFADRGVVFGGTDNAVVLGQWIEALIDNRFLEGASASLARRSMSDGGAATMMPRGFADENSWFCLGPRTVVSQGRRPRRPWWPAQGTFATFSR